MFIYIHNSTHIYNSTQASRLLIDNSIPHSGGDYYNDSQQSLKLLLATVTIIIHSIRVKPFETLAKISLPFCKKNLEREYETKRMTICSVNQKMSSKRENRKISVNIV